MKFTSLIATLQDLGGGIHGYRALANAAYEKACCERHAAAYYILAKQADDFIEFNERMAVPAHESDAMFDRMSANAEALETAFASGDQVVVLEVLDKIAREGAAMRNTT